MKLALECYDCLQRLIRQAANLATDDTLLQEKAVGEAMKVLDSEFSYNEISIVIATRIHKAIREITHNPDPYWAMKEKEVAISRELYPGMKLRCRDNLPVLSMWLSPHLFKTMLPWRISVMLVWKLSLELL